MTWDDQPTQEKLDQEAQMVLAAPIGEELLLWANGDYRSSVVIAKFTNETLVEITMRHGSTFLRLYEYYFDKYVTRRFTNSGCPYRFIDQMIANNISWVCNPRGSDRKGTPAEIKALGKKLRQIEHRRARQG